MALYLVTLAIRIAVEGDDGILLQIYLCLVQVVVGDDKCLVVRPVPHANEYYVWTRLLVRCCHGDDALLLEDRLDLG
jgi:hypothetical protein